MMRPLAWLVAATLLVACRPPAAVVARGALADRDLAMGWVDASARDKGSYNEQLVLRVRLDDDAGDVYIKLQVTNLAAANGQAVLTGNVGFADGRRFRSRTKRKRGSWQAGRERFVAEVGDSRLDIGIGGGFVHIEGDDFAFDLEITSEIPPLRPGGGVVDVGGAFYKTTLLVPRGRAEGVLYVTPERNERAWQEAIAAGRAKAEDGEEAEQGDGAGVDGGAPGGANDPSTTPLPAHVALESEVHEPGAEDADGVFEPLSPEELELGGAVYVEHRVGTIAPWVLAKRWYNLIDVGANYTLVMSAFERAEALGGGNQGWLFVAEDGALELYEPELEVGPTAFTTHDETGYHVPQVLFLHDQGRRGFRGVVKGDVLTRTKDDLSGLSRLERFVVRRLMRPWTFTFGDARFLFRKRRSEGHDKAYRGNVLYRYQQLSD